MPSLLDNVSCQNMILDNFVHRFVCERVHLERLERQVDQSLDVNRFEVEAFEDLRQVFLYLLAGKDPGLSGHCSQLFEVTGTVIPVGL